MFNINKPIMTIHECVEMCEFLKAIIHQVPENSAYFRSIHEFTNEMQVRQLVRYTGC